MPKSKVTITDAELLALQASGLSQIKIADQLGVSVNCVGGKLNRAKRRLGIATSPFRFGIPVKRQNREAHGCRWVDGEPGHGPWSFCCKPTVSVLSAWCAEHRARAYVKVRPVVKKVVVDWKF